MINLNIIKDVSTIEELSKFDTLIRKYSKSIIPCNDTADDIVNDMYIKLNSVMERGSIINGGYVYITLKNLYSNHRKININRYDFGNAYECSYIPDNINDDLDIDNKIMIEGLYNDMDDRISLLSWYEQKILSFSYIISMSELSRKSGISYRSLCYSKLKINEKLGIKNKKNNK